MFLTEYFGWEVCYSSRKWTKTTSSKSEKENKINGVVHEQASFREFNTPWYRTFFSAGNELNALEKVVFPTWDEEKVATRPVNEFLWNWNLKREIKMFVVSSKHGRKSLTQIPPSQKNSSTNYFVIKKTACREAYHSALTNSRVLILQMCGSYRLETALKTLKIAENQGFSLLRRN